MPALVQQIDGLPLVEKVQLVQHLLASLAHCFDDAQLQNYWRKVDKPQRIGLMKGKWRVPTEEEDQAMDKEILEMFNLDEAVA